MAEIIGVQSREVGDYLPISRYLTADDIVQTAEACGVEVDIHNNTFRIRKGFTTSQQSDFRVALNSLVEQRKAEKETLLIALEEAREDIVTNYSLIVPSRYQSQVMDVLRRMNIPLDEYRYRETGAGNRIYDLEITPKQSDILVIRLKQIDMNLGGMLNIAELST